MFNILMWDMLHMRNERGANLNIDAKVCFKRGRCIIVENNNGNDEEWMRLPASPSVDDLAIFIMCKDPNVLLEDFSITASIVDHTFAEYLLSVDFNPGRAGAVVSLVGPGASDVKAKLQVEFESRLPFQGVDGVAHLRCVAEHVHLGTNLHCNALMTPEMRRRLTAMHVAVVSDLTSIFRSKRVSTENNEKHRKCARHPNFVSRASLGDPSPPHRQIF